ncbi:hypothetical protein N7478_008372 [Penicillium angulare]|uniref:uncharacterized protein n=1 Tax=Penicillium angulare TaxID=116970 RepID=UPI00254197FE|nr:uncharacterized protein N7478_008372 [Penicillium angulare]KAJ5273247.1 hypothetical protein N7478_008372 [Penicillium angulare]
MRPLIWKIQPPPFQKAGRRNTFHISADFALFVNNILEERDQGYNDVLKHHFFIFLSFRHILNADIDFLGRKSNPDSQTVELGPEFLDTITVQGREYHKYSIDHRTYFGPVDDEEAQRLDSQQQVFQRLFDDRLIFPPIQRLQRVLDCGHGAASWAVDVAEQYPDCEVTGIDIAPHMSPDDVPDNLWLQVDDLNRPFTFPSNHFDLVHSRLLATGIHRRRWPSYVRDILRVLKPGGWVQMVEIYYNVQSDNGAITDEHALRRWSTQYMRALEDRKDLRVGSKLQNYLTGLGLVEVDAKMIPLPLSGWSNG